jgi:hypothetical protein
MKPGRFDFWWGELRQTGVATLRGKPSSYDSDKLRVRRKMAALRIDEGEIWRELELSK